MVVLACVNTLVAIHGDRFSVSVTRATTWRPTLEAAMVYVHYNYVECVCCKINDYDDYDYDDEPTRVLISHSMFIGVDFLAWHKLINRLSLLHESAKQVYADFAPRKNSTNTAVQVVLYTFGYC